MMEYVNWTTSLEEIVCDTVHGVAVYDNSLWMECTRLRYMESVRTRCGFAPTNDSYFSSIAPMEHVLRDEYMEWMTHDRWFQVYCGNDMKMGSEQARAFWRDTVAKAPIHEFRLNDDCKIEIFLSGHWAAPSCVCYSV